jgi:hypothetical protein
MLETVVKYILGEFRVIADAPVSFLTSLLAFIELYGSPSNGVMGRAIQRDAEISSLRTQRTNIATSLH